ncbi:hypothetical protein MNBD_GAMMA01-107 [hydrothermal vent metagenome]|uniref:Uncharacterized protein n=1 Tax=hydrothermal vent metagenome TaxID=652676 RepID=A0A3B0V465_9ZZZZ
MSLLSLSTINKIERQIQSAKSFQYIASNSLEQIIGALRQISVRSGLAIYIWSDLGLVNIQSRQMPLPGTKTVLEALKYATKNHYFAVYVFPGVNARNLLEIKSTLPTSSAYLKVNKNTRFLFLINKDTNFNFLTANAEEIQLGNQYTQKYKLRDSKWLLANE